MSVQFETLQRLKSPHLGLLWQMYRDSYPKAEHYPPLANVVESFDPPAQMKAGISFEPTFPVPRCWFLNDEGTKLIQVQQDRFVLNWRRLDTDEEYPRYTAIRALFVEELDRFTDFIDREGLGELVYNQGELTYVNHIAAGPGWKELSELCDVTILCGERRPGYLPVAEGVQANLVYVMPGFERPHGRLYIDLDTPLSKKDGQRMIRLNMVARGAPEEKGLAGILQFIDQAHEWIVEGFTSITTDQMHNIWERTR